MGLLGAHPSRALPEGRVGLTLRTILWDNDGVLVDTEELYFEATRQVLARAGTCEECVAVEDSVRGLRAARAAGIRCIVVPNALTRGVDFEGAHAVVYDLRGAYAEIHRLMET